MARPPVRDLGISGVKNRHQLIAWLRKRDGMDCCICGNPITKKSGFWGPSIEHKQPLSKGGKHTPENIGLAHTLCNNLKGNGTNGDDQQSGAEQ